MKATEGLMECSDELHEVISLMKLRKMTENSAKESKMDTEELKIEVR